MNQLCSREAGCNPHRRAASEDIDINITSYDDLKSGTADTHTQTDDKDSKAYDSEGDASKAAHSPIGSTRDQAPITQPD